MNVNSFGMKGKKSNGAGCVYHGMQMKEKLQQLYQLSTYTDM